MRANPPDPRDERIAALEKDLAWARTDVANQARDISGLLDKVTRIEGERDAARELLAEWLDTPFFDTREKWDAWVGAFRNKVYAALGRK